MLAQGKSEGRIRISVPLFPKDLFSDALDYDKGYVLYVLGARKRVSVPRVARTEKENPVTGSVLDVDQYEIQLPPGTYELKIEGIPGFRLPKFKVVAGELIDFTLPQYQFAWRLACYDHLMAVWMNYDDLETPIVQRPVEIETRTLDRASSAVIYHCGKLTAGEITNYASGRIFVKNHFFSGRSLEVDWRNHTFKLKGPKDGTVEYVLNGGDVRVASELTFNFLSGSVISIKE